MIILVQLWQTILELINIKMQLLLILSVHWIKNLKNQVLNSISKIGKSNGYALPDLMNASQNLIHLKTLLKKHLFIILYFNFLLANYAKSSAARASNTSYT